MSQCIHNKDKDKEDALQLILIILDSELSADLRQEAVLTLEELFIFECIPKYLECIFSTITLPKCADIDTAIKFCQFIPANLVGNFLKKVNEEITETQK